MLSSPLLPLIVAGCALLIALYSSGQARSAVRSLASLDPEQAEARLTRVIGEHRAGLLEAQESLSRTHQSLQAYYARLSGIERKLLGHVPAPPPEEPDEDLEDDGPADPKGDAIAAAAAIGLI